MSFPFPIDEITEGSIKLTVPKLALFAQGTSEYIPSKAPVFYNPLMQLNRDIAIAALNIYQKRVNHRLYICDPLSGCGVRGLRFAREVDSVDFVVLNDLSLQAAKLVQFNADKNGLANKVKVENLAARVLFENYASRKRFDVIDIDPYGSPAPFLDSALTALRNRGFLALTATDTAPLCGINPKVCIRKYFGKSLRTEYCHELALRLLINSVVFSAARYDLGINVLFSHSTNHYLRVYVQLRHGAKRANEAIEKLGYVLHCFNCLNRKWVLGLTPCFDRRCDVCSGEMNVAGPLWLSKLVDEDFCKEISKAARKARLGTMRRLSQLLATIIKETDMPPTYFVLDKICGKLGISAKSRDRVIEKIIKMGYHAVRTHFNPQGIKSDAPIQVIKEVIKSVI